jgi:hypothetical protein
LQATASIETTRLRAYFRREIGGYSR